MGWKTANAMRANLAHCPHGGHGERALSIALEMADTARDDPERVAEGDKPPRRYFAGYGPLADAIGRTWTPNPETEDERRANKRAAATIDRSVARLIEHGHIRRIRKAVNGWHAEYELLPDLTDFKADIEASDFKLDNDQRTPQ